MTPLQRFHERFVKANPRTAAIGLSAMAALIVRMFPELTERLGPIANHESLERLTLVLVMLQGFFGSDAKEQMPARELQGDTEVVVEKGEHQ